MNGQSPSLATDYIGSPSPGQATPARFATGTVPPGSPGGAVTGRNPQMKFLYHELGTGGKISKDAMATCSRHQYQNALARSGSCGYSRPWFISRAAFQGCQDFIKDPGAPLSVGCVAGIGDGRDGWVRQHKGKQDSGGVPQTGSQVCPSKPGSPGAEPQEPPRGLASWPPVLLPASVPLFMRVPASRQNFYNQ